MLSVIQATCPGSRRQAFVETHVRILPGPPEVHLVRHADQADDAFLYRIPGVSVSEIWPSACSELSS